MKFGITNKDLSLIIHEIKKNLGSTKKPQLFLYGSRAKGNNRKFSDIDLLLKAESFDEASLSKIDFSELDISYKIDLVLDKYLYEAYRDEIEGHMVSISLLDVIV